MTGKGFTVMLRLAVFEQPFASVPVTVYIVDEEGVAETLAPVSADKPVAGVHAYVAPPCAVSCTDSCRQITAVSGLAVITGSGFTVTVTLALAVQPPAMVPVTI